MHVDLKKDDGYTPLHLAALNDHLDVVTAFAEVVSVPQLVWCIPTITGLLQRRSDNRTHLYNN